MKPLTPQDRQQAEALLAGIQRRPAYHLACAWLTRAIRTYAEPIGEPDEFQGGWIDVERVQKAIEVNAGAHVCIETLLAALVACGFSVRDTRRGPETDLAERVMLEAWATSQFGTEPARPLPDLSDATDTHLRMH